MRRKHSDRILLADRVKSDLLAGTHRALDEGTLDIDTVGATARADAIALLERWDNTAAPASRGGVLFARWWARYTDAIEAAYDGDGDPEPFAEGWTPEAPTCASRIPNSLAASRIEATLRGAWRLASSNEVRSHASLKGHTPLTFAGGHMVARAELNNVR